MPHPRPVLRIALLGSFAVQGPKANASGLNRRKSQALLARLAVPLGQPVSRAALTNLLWGEVSPDQARDSFRHALTDIRKALGPSVLLTDGDTVALAADAVAVDVSDFERLVRDGTPAALEAAVSGYAGDFLEGFDIRENAFEVWARGERERL